MCAEDQERLTYVTLTYPNCGCFMAASPGDVNISHRSLISYLYMGIGLRNRNQAIETGTCFAGPQLMY